MKKLYEKDEIWFAVAWIILYVVGFGNADSLSEAIGIPKLLTVLLGLVLTLILYGFLRKYRLTQYYGLCPVRGKWGNFLYFLPLVLISSVNFWNGLTLNAPWPETILHILSMCFVAFLEEVIFRGLLFQGLGKSGFLFAVIVSSVTFGAGHIVNLFLGEPLLDTLLQLVYASAIGFCYTAVFCAGGSLLPCILSHAFVNATSIFAAEPTAPMQILIAIVQTLLGTAYGIFLLRACKQTTGGISHDKG